MKIIEFYTDNVQVSHAGIIDSKKVRAEVSVKEILNQFTDEEMFDCMNERRNYNKFYEKIQQEISATPKGHEGA